VAQPPLSQPQLPQPQAFQPQEFQPQAFPQLPPSQPQLPQAPQPAIQAAPAQAASQLPALYSPAPAPSGVERLFAQDRMPPAPTTDERLPIFEAMESEWFRRRDEARNQAQQAAAAQSAPLPPAPRFDPGSDPAMAPAAVSAPVSTQSSITARPVDTLPSEPASIAGSVKAPAAQRVNNDYPQPSPAPIADAASDSGSGIPSVVALGAPVQPAPGEAAAPIQALPTEPIPGLEQPRAAAGGVPPMEPVPSATGADRIWDSPGDEGWRAAQAAAKPVAAGLTTKGLPKRVPKSNLVPGSAGGTGAAKASSPVFPPRSAEAVRGRLSSFHQGLRQGRDAASGAEDEPGQETDEK